MREIFYQLPLWVSAIVVLGLTVGVCVGGHLGVRALIPHRASEEVTSLATAVMGVVSAFIGIMLAFAAVQVWQDYLVADEAVAREAAVTAELYRDLTTYGPETIPARAAVKTYVVAVLDDEWPRLAKGEASPRAIAALDGMFAVMGTIQPRTPRDTVIYGEVFKKLNEVVDHRRSRLIASRAELPVLFWLVVIAGSAIIVSYTFVYPANWANELIIAGLAVSLGLIFLFILAVDHPFSGTYSVDARELRDLLPLFERLSEGL
ncbi:hypothetical protein [Phenylobacterium sp.]|uniref:bestrophin-like domain n=1 Tax=Phenylobacterium sp. TaxID=1871053 RepID=UPI0039836325